MPYSNSQAAHSHVEMLMDIATTLADYTQSAALAAQIPGYLSRTLDLEPLTLAVARHSSDEGAPSISLLSSSGPLAAPGGAFIGHILDVTKPVAAAQLPVLRSPFADGNTVAMSDRGFTEMAISEVAGFPRGLVFVRTIDDTHRLCLILHQRAGSLAPSLVQIDSLDLVLGLLSKLLRCMIAWQDKPELLGAGFGRLTDREWVVLQGLNSDDGEKQLADRLSLSPHTLHSHIKSIYRKVGVQGRLPLLLRLNAAVRELRQAAISRAPVRVQTPNFAVAVG